MIGPALGGLVADWGVRAPFFIAAGLALINAATMYFFLPETLDPANRRPLRLREAHVIGAFRPLFQAGNAAPLLVAWFLWQLGGVVYPATWAFWASIRFGWDAGEIGWSLAWVGFLSVVVQLVLTPRIMPWLGERRAAVVGLAAAAVTLLAYAFTTHGWQVYAFFLVGCLGAFAYPALNGILTSHGRRDAPRRAARWARRHEQRLRDPRPADRRAKPRLGIGARLRRGGVPHRRAADERLGPDHRVRDAAAGTGETGG